MEEYAIIFVSAYTHFMIRMCAMAMKKNVVISQSGGPTPVINNSLRGVIDACKSYPDTFGTIYAGFHGVEGILKEELLNLSAQDETEIALLRTTPAAGSIGTCRYKLKEHQKEDFARVIEVLKAHDIGYLFYIGGNDSMDTANKISRLAHECGLDLIATGVPKTIDNDVGDSEFKLIDHTPGYGSVARYWASYIQNANEENMGSCPSDPVLVVQAMGRSIGFIPAAARLADPKRQMPLQIYMVESGAGLEEIVDNVNDMLKACGRAVVVVGEGLPLGSIGESRDAFGHKQYGSSQMTVSQIVVNYLNQKGLPVHGSARGQVPGTDQRSAIQLASTVDLDEAYKLGQKAVEIAAREGNGYMSTILRKPGEIYRVEYDKVPLEAVANSERAFPKAWIAENRMDVTDDFIRYAKPLIGEDWVSIPMVDGLMRFTRFKPIFAEQKLDKYVPQGYR
jgi:6-phosphofructokinase